MLRKRWNNRRRNRQGRLGGGDEEVTGEEGVESSDMLGEETEEDGGCKSTGGGEAEGVERIGTGATGVIGESGKVRKEISSTEKIEEDGRG